MNVLVIHPHLNVRGGSERLTKILLDGLKDVGAEYRVITALYDEEWFRDHSNRVILLRPGMSL
ncbi:MAG: hypothetical protein GXO23_01390, partial [Crenarchaeota archaeon]|nr:hypothetical protein [Thermoproteota archaeon]